VANRKLIKTMGIICLGIWMTAFAYAQTDSSSYVKPYQKKALDIYRTAVSFRTAKGQAQTPALAKYLAKEFLNGGFKEEDIHLLSFDEMSEPTNALVIRYRGNGASGKKPILLVAHMDVVDAHREDWDRDPFTLVEEDGYFFGRGTLDDKSGIATLTAAFLRLKSDGFVPNRDLIIAFTADEETGSSTTQSLMDEYRQLTDAEFALNADAGGGDLDENGSATAYNLQCAEKTYCTFELTAINPGGHSSYPRSDNAIYELAAALGRLNAFRFPVRSNDITRAYFASKAKVTQGEVGEAMAHLSEDPDDEWAANILWTQPGEVGITRTTCVATMLKAGHAENALPQSATATVNCRIFPGVTVEEVHQTLKQVVADENLEIKVLDDPETSPASSLREDVINAVTKAVHARYPDIPILTYMSPFATDGNVIRRAGIPTYGVSGIFIKSSDVFAHGLDERVPVASFFDALEYLHILLTELTD
jgi:carboxypeptidase PM20D1